MSAKQTQVRFHSELYPDAAITEATQTFEGYATFSLHDEQEHHVVEISDMADVEGDIVAEFCNFVLANAAAMRRGGDA